MSDSPVPQNSLMDEDIWENILAHPSFDPQNLYENPVENPKKSKDLLNHKNNEPIKIQPKTVLKRHSHKKKGSHKTRNEIEYLRPHIKSLFKSLTYSERSNLINVLLRVISDLEKTTNKYDEVFEDFYYDVETEDFEPMNNVYNEFDNTEICFLDEYEREYKSLLLVSNLERDFWENGERIIKKAKKKKKKRQSTVRTKIQRLMEERDEFYNLDAYFSNKIKNDEKDFKLKISKSELNQTNKSTEGAYGLRERKKSKVLMQKIDESVIDKDEAYIFNKRFRLKYYQLIKQNNRNIKPHTPPKGKLPVIVPQKVLQKQVEENLALHLIKQKNNFPSCFIQEKQPKEEEEKEVNSKTETVKLTDLGPKKVTRKYVKKKERQRKTKEIEPPKISKECNETQEPKDSKELKTSEETQEQNGSKTYKRTRVRKEPKTPKAPKAPKMKTIKKKNKKERIKKKYDRKYEKTASNSNRNKRKKKPLIKEMISVDMDESKEPPANKTNIIWEFDFNFNEV